MEIEDVVFALIVKESKRIWRYRGPCEAVAAVNRARAALSPSLSSAAKENLLYALAGVFVCMRGEREGGREGERERERGRERGRERERVQREQLLYASALRARFSC